MLSAICFSSHGYWSIWTVAVSATDILIAWLSELILVMRRRPLIYLVMYVTKLYLFLECEASMENISSHAKDISHQNKLKRLIIKHGEQVNRWVSTDFTKVFG